MACTHCHAAKVKCVPAHKGAAGADAQSTTSGHTDASNSNNHGLPCQRCVRLDLNCVLHESRQGQGKKTRKASRGSTSSSGNNKRQRSLQDATASSSKNTAAAEGGPKLDRGVTESVISGESNNFLSRHHFGLYFIIRQWMAFAVTRRSMHLLGRACALAAKCGITMDDILCGTARYGKDIPMESSPAPGGPAATSSSKDIHHKMNPLFAAAMMNLQQQQPLDGVNDNGSTTTASSSSSKAPGMEFMANFLFMPAKKQQVIGPPLQLTEIPLKLLSAIYCCPSLSNLAGRWVLVREMKFGQSRYFVSEAFAQDIASYDTIVDTYLANTKEVKDIWTLREDDQYKHSLGLIHQIRLCKKFEDLPHPAQISSTQIRLKGGQDVECDCIVCMAIVGLDHCYYFVEYHSPRLPPLPAVLPTPEPTAPAEAPTFLGGAMWGETNNNNNNNSSEGAAGEAPLLSITHRLNGPRDFNDNVSELDLDDDLYGWLDEIQKLW